tara:strand:+ start:316 stop:513 length:198 start_codon:yes stop_codon:yes gene_type:complete
MSDLVKRLRKLAERERPYGSLPDTLDEAAARIEQLEAALREIKRGAVWNADIEVFISAALGEDRT